MHDPETDPDPLLVLIDELGPDDVEDLIADELDADEATTRLDG